MDPSNKVTPSPPRNAKKKKSRKKKKKSKEESIKSVRFVASSREEPFRQNGKQGITSQEFSISNNRNNRNDRKNHPRRSQENKSNNGMFPDSSCVMPLQNENDLMCLGCLTNGDLIDLMDSYNEALNPGPAAKNKTYPSVTKVTATKPVTIGQQKNMMDDSGGRFSFMSCADLTSCTDIGFEMETSSEEEYSEDDDESESDPNFRRNGKGKRQKDRKVQGQRTTLVKDLSSDSDQYAHCVSSLPHSKGQKKKTFRFIPKQTSNEKKSIDYFDTGQHQKQVEAHLNAYCYSEEKVSGCSVVAAEGFVMNGTDGSLLPKEQEEDDFIYFDGGNDDGSVADWSSPQNWKGTHQIQEVRGNAITSVTSGEHPNSIQGGASLASLEYSDTDDGYGDRYAQMILQEQRQFSTIPEATKRTFSV